MHNTRMRARTEVADQHKTLPDLTEPNLANAYKITGNNKKIKKISQTGLQTMHNTRMQARTEVADQHKTLPDLTETNWANAYKITGNKIKKQKF